MKWFRTRGNLTSILGKPTALLMALLLAGALGACTADNSQMTSKDPKTPDAGKADVAPDVVEEPDAAEEPDTYVEPPPSAGSTHGRCASAGETAGGGFQLVHCTAPDTPAAQPMAGGGFQAQPGALRVILPAP